MNHIRQVTCNNISYTCDFKRMVYTKEYTRNGINKRDLKEMKYEGGLLKIKSNPDVFLAEWGALIKPFQKAYQEYLVDLILLEEEI